MNKETKLRVWHAPQLPVDLIFYVPVKDVEEAIKVVNILADYDLFQFENRIKPDYSNMSGLEVLDEKNQEWHEWYDDETGFNIEEIEALTSKGE